MFIVNHPGPWQYYVNRPDNKGLNIMEIKSKYLKEQLLFEQYMSFQMQQQMLLSQNASGGGEVEPVPTPEPPTPVSTDFIIRIDTTLGNGLDSYIVPTRGELTYNYDVAWEEVGNSSNSGVVTNQTGNATINFPSSGQYDLSISGLFPAIYVNNSGDDLKLIDIVNWGDNEWQSMGRAFWGCANLSLYSATDSPDLSSVTDMSYMFQGATQFNGDISGWDVSNVTRMDSMFSNAQAFNQDISGWNVSGVTNMGFMFYNTNSFNQDISGWNVSNVTNMFAMFNNATSFNQDLSGWCVSLIPSEPTNFDTGAVAWFLPKPVWGTCP